MKKSGKKSIKIEQSGFAGSILLDGLLPKRKDIWIKQSERYTDRACNVSQLNFFEDPTSTLKKLSEIIRHECTTKTLTLNFEEKTCLDMAPYMILALMAKNFNPKWIISATCTKSLHEVLKATKLSEKLNLEELKEESYPEDIWPFELESICGEHSTLQTPHALTARRFTDSVNNWLSKVEWTLTADGSDYLSKMTAEVLDNAIIHSRPGTEDKTTGGLISGASGEAHIAGYMTKRKVGNQDRYTCHFSVVSVGSSIFESLNKTCPNHTRDQINNLIKSHNKSLRSNWEKKDLWTLYALQDGVSRFKQAGGRGFMELINFFVKFGHRKEEEVSLNGVLPSQLVILSGNTYIKVDGIAPKKDAKGFWSLAFNKENDLKKPPSGKAVYNLGNYKFPGTVLTVRFELNDEYLEKSHS